MASACDRLQTGLRVVQIACGHLFGFFLFAMMPAFFGGFFGALLHGAQLT